MRCPVVTVEFLPAVIGALPLSVYRTSPSTIAGESGLEGTENSELVSADHVGVLVTDDQEGVLGLLRFLQAQTEKHSYPTALLEGTTAHPTALQTNAQLL